jgi:putative spermidine/putrescine transport system permease protein
MLILIPFIPLFLWSFSVSWRWPHLFPEWGTRAWTTIFSAQSSTWEAIAVSMQIAIMTTLMNLLLAIPAANAIARYSFKGKRFIEALLFLPIIVPPFVSTMGIYSTFIRWNLTDTLAGVILVHIVPTLPYLIRPLILSFRTLGFEWEDQARMLGANWMQRFRHVVFPHLLPAIVAGASISILVSLSQYLITLLIGGGLIQTLPLLMFPFISGGDPAVGAGYAFLFVFVSILTLWLMERLLNNYYGKQTWIHV